MLSNRVPSTSKLMMTFSMTAPSKKFDMIGHSACVDEKAHSDIDASYRKYRIPYRILELSNGIHKCHGPCCPGHR